MPHVESFSIDNEGEADKYLEALFKKPSGSSLDDLERRCTQYVKDVRIKTYFMDRGREMLRRAKS